MQPIYRCWRASKSAGMQLAASAIYSSAIFAFAVGNPDLPDDRSHEPVAVALLVPSTGEDNPTQPDTTGQGTTPTTITRRLTNWFEDLRLSVKRVEERPDHPSGDIVYLVKDVFTTRDGAWDVTSDRYAVPQWAKDSYLAGFSKAHERNNLYAAVLDLDGKFLSGQEILFWTGGIGKLSDLGSTTTARKTASEQPGWATMMMFGSSAYDPAAGQNGPWCWTPNGLPGRGSLRRRSTRQWTKRVDLCGLAGGQKR